MAEKKFYVSKECLEEDYKVLGTIQRVAEKHNVSKKLVLNYMNFHKIPRNKKSDKSEVAHEICCLAKKGLNSNEIAKQKNMSLTQVNKYIKLFDIPVERYHKGFTKTWSGYILLYKPGYPKANKKGYVREHVFVIEEFLGRTLTEDEVVHHIDENKANNKIENLQLMTKYEHKCLHSSKPRKTLNTEL